MSLKARVKKLEREIQPGEEIKITIKTAITNRREVLLGQAPPDEALGDRIEEKTIRVNL